MKHKNLLTMNRNKPIIPHPPPLNTGEVAILRVGEDGFIYRRETEYIEVVGIAEILCDDFTVDIDKWSFSETIVHRKNIFVNEILQVGDAKKK